jgi:hypothetical protein
LAQEFGGHLPGRGHERGASHTTVDRIG